MEQHGEPQKITSPLAFAEGLFCYKRRIYENYQVLIAEQV